MLKQHLIIVLIYVLLFSCSHQSGENNLLNSDVPDIPDQESYGEQVNLLSNYSWDKFSGASVNEDNTVSVKPIGKMIRPLADGRQKWYYNPPINFAGPQIRIDKEMNLECHIDLSEHPDKWAYLDFYGEIPICFDEWRVEGEIFRIGLKDGTAKLWINMKEQKLDLNNLGTSVKIKIIKVNDYLYFYFNNEHVFSVADKVIVNNKLYFGADAQEGGGFRITDLKVSGTNLSVIDNYTNLIKTYPQKDNSLRYYSEQLALKEKKDFWICTAVNANALMRDSEYGKILAQEFNAITPELDFKFQAIHPLENSYSWAEADLIVDFAKKNNMRMRGHALIWHEALPKWVWDYYRSGNKEKIKEILETHIRTVMARYKGRIKEWDILNEIHSQEHMSPESDYYSEYGLRDDNEGYGFPSIWYWAYDGAGFILDSIRIAREVDPDCELWINEFAIDGFYSNDKLDNIIKTIQYIRNNGLEIDGVGFQGHNYNPVTDPCHASECLEQMQKIGELGVKVRISELDVADASNHPTLFSDKLDICTDFSENPTCTGLSFWGFSDKYGSMSWPENEDSAANSYISPNWGYYTPDSLPFDVNYNKRSAYNKMIDILKSKLN